MSRSFYANRGKKFEDLIKFQNEQYYKNGLGLVNKIDTGWIPVRGKSGVESAFVRGKSTVDFIGLGVLGALAFDAKETKKETSWPFPKEFEHQMKYLGDFAKFGGHAFVLLKQTKTETVYFIPYEEIKPYWEESKRGGRKSLPFSFIKTCPVVRSTINGPIDYFAVIKQLQLIKSQAK